MRDSVKIFDQAKPAVTPSSKELEKTKELLVEAQGKLAGLQHQNEELQQQLRNAQEATAQTTAKQETNEEKEAVEKELGNAREKLREVQEEYEELKRKYIGISLFFWWWIPKKTNNPSHLSIQKLGLYLIMRKPNGRCVKKSWNSFSPKRMLLRWN